VSTGGFGLTISGVPVPWWHSEDRIKFAVYSGWGVGRYITDLDAAGRQDAVYDVNTNTLRALPMSSAYVAYERRWAPRFLSALAYGVVTVHNLDVQVNDSLRRTQRTTANIAWTPIPRADFLLEFLAGERVNKDGERGASTQVQAGGSCGSNWAGRAGRSGRAGGCGQTKESRHMAVQEVGSATTMREAPGAPPFPDMVWIPAATYRMGSDKHYPEERPVHKVSVDGSGSIAIPSLTSASRGSSRRRVTSPSRRSRPTPRSIRGRCRTCCTPGRWCS
jgi:hypothetical protein